MVAQYTIAGRQVGSHVLAMLTLGTIGLGTYASMGGSKPAPAAAVKPTGGSEEENFIANFIKEAEQEEKKAKH